jgi:hypothetical protein
MRRQYSCLQDYGPPSRAFLRPQLNCGPLSRNQEITGFNSCLEPWAQGWLCSVPESGLSMLDSLDGSALDLDRERASLESPQWGFHVAPNKVSDCPWKWGCDRCNAGRRMAMSLEVDWMWLLQHFRISIAPNRHNSPFSRPSIHQS